ncbi:hypothetical protein HNS30_07870 [Corallococcus exercitus]|uniref:DUF2007 domain-containing protein n=1 Tax=Corallococcus exercitus TaxID=2316736 RepID=A0A7Y4JPT1_9BACT|nr:hypothetical protein [Corallococcus exercitus]
MGIPDHDFQLLTTCGDSSEAALLRGLLEANGIPCIVQGEQHRSMLGVAGPTSRCGCWSRPARWSAPGNCSRACRRRNRPGTASP